MPKNKEYKEFSDRLNLLLDESLFPLYGKGRQVLLGKNYGVSQNAAGKWVSGESIPRKAKIVAICSDFGYRPDWLLWGEGAKKNPHKENDPSAEDMELAIQIGKLKEQHKKMVLSLVKSYQQEQRPKES